MARQGTARSSRSSPRGGRRTQAERSAATRARLLDAALVCLAECGWAGTTTTTVAERAGVSRGAELHHFPTRAELVAAAVQHLAEKRLEEFGRKVARLPAGSDPVAAGIELLWSMFSDETAYALLELLVAARTDPELRRRLAPVARRLEVRFDVFARETFPEAQHPSRRLTQRRDVVFVLLQGLALAEIVEPDRERRARLLGVAEDVCRRTLRAIAKEAP